MARSEFVRRIAQGLSVPESEAAKIADAVVGGIEAVLRGHGRLEIRDFGVFRIQERKARMGRNPRTLEPYPIPARRVVTFRMSKQPRRMAAGEDRASGEIPEDVVTPALPEIEKESQNRS